MKQYIPVLKNTRLFSGVGEENIEKMLNCLRARLRTYKKGEFVLRQGEQLNCIMTLAEGTLHIQRDDHWGNRSIISAISPSELFGEAYAPGNEPLLIDVLAVEDSAVIFFDINRILTVCSSGCRFHTIVVQNLFYTLSEKNRNLVRKLGYLSERSTRGKLIAYLSDEAKRSNSSEFTIPFNRQQLADYLAVDRSAMSAELCRMRDEGLLKFDRNWFILL